VRNAHTAAVLGENRMFDVKEAEQKRRSPAEIAMMVQDGWECFSDIAAVIPPEITDALADRAINGEVKGVRWGSILDIEPLRILSKEASRGITPVSWFSGKQFAAAVNEGRADIMPCSYKDMPEYAAGLEKLDAIFIRTSSMDSEGFFHVGTAGSLMEVLIKKAEHIFVEADPHMPSHEGCPKLHISEVDAYCESDRELPEVHSAATDEASKRIAEIIADQIPDRATVQLGIGAIPEACGKLLRDKKELGIHTELFSDSYMELIECGAATNAFKEEYTGKSVATVAFGSKKLYSFLEGNLDVLMLPVNVTNDPYLIAKHKNFISINGALEVDLFGQVCAESLGTRHVSGSGGQGDFVRGAVMSEGGKSFIAFPSTAAKGTLSRIKPLLSEGAVVTTGKNDVDMIVTEYGLAKLRGKTLSQRVKALISIAHPDFRDELIFYAKQRGMI